MSDQHVIRTGIAGLDELLLGGLPRTNVVLVEGTTGCGKTLLGVEFIYRGITEFHEPGIIVVFEISPDKLIRDAATLGWDLAELQAEKKLQIVYTSPHVLDQELHSPHSLLLETAKEIGAQRIFIDGIGLMRQVIQPGTATAMGRGSYRELLQQLIEELNRERLTAMFSHEMGVCPESLLTLEGTEFLVDTVIRLKRTVVNRRVHRSFEIVKSRGHEYTPGEHTLQIHNGKGLHVYRRVQAPVYREQPTSMAKRSVIGVHALDVLLGGGVLDGSTTLVVGLSGVGKTILATQILLEGATQQNERGLLISLDEHPAQIVRNAESLGLGLQAQVDAGAIHLLFESPQELDIDAHFARIVQTIEQYDIKRMIIDGLTSYSTALENQTVYRDFFHAIVGYSKHRLMTAFFNYENPEFLGLSSFMPDFPVPSIVDNIILLNLVEIKNMLRRCITVAKARASKHVFDSREYVIEQGGIKLLPCDEDLETPQPLASYHSILSRAATRMPVGSRQLS